MVGQLVAAGAAVALVLGGVDSAGLGEHVPGELLVGADRRIGGGGAELGAVDGEHADLDQAALGAEPEHLAEEIGEGLLVADPEAGDRGVVGAWFAQITRKATSSRQRRSIPRDDRSPTQ